MIVRTLSYIVVIFLHGHYPRNVVEGNGTKTEVCVIWNPSNLLDKAIEIGCRDTIYGGDEVCRGKTIVVRRRATALENMVSHILPPVIGRVLLTLALT